MGYSRAGFDVVGVDIEPQRHYPFEFIQADALEFMASGGWRAFNGIHASPPCQAFARIGAVNGVRGNYPDLLVPTREALAATGLPWVIENVPDSKLPDSFLLCGSSFGLKAVGALDGIERQLRRHRLFQANFLVLAPSCQHRGEPIGVYGHGGPQRATRNRGYMGSMGERVQAMEIDWMNRDEMSQAIPPAYTEFIGRVMHQFLGR